MAEKRTILKRSHNTDADLEAQLALGQLGYSKGSGRLIQKARDLDAFGDPIIRKYPPLTEVEDLIAANSGGNTWKASVATFGDLPLSDAVGDARIVRDEGVAYWWNGTAWEILGTDGSVGALLHGWTEVTLDGASPVPAGFSLQVACTAFGQVIWRGSTGYLVDPAGPTWFESADLPSWAMPAEGVPGVLGADSLSCWTDTLGSYVAACGTYLNQVKLTVNNRGATSRRIAAQVPALSSGRWALDGITYPSYDYHRADSPLELPRLGGGGGDHNVAADAGDPSPGTLVDKIVDANGAPLSVIVDGGIRKLQLPGTDLGAFRIIENLTQLAEFFAEDALVLTGLVSGEIIFAHGVNTFDFRGRKQLHFGAFSGHSDTDLAFNLLSGYGSLYIYSPFAFAGGTPDISATGGMKELWLKRASQIGVPPAFTATGWATGAYYETTQFPTITMGAGWTQTFWDDTSGDYRAAADTSDANPATLAEKLVDGSGAAFPVIVDGGVRKVQIDAGGTVAGLYSVSDWATLKTALEDTSVARKFIVSTVSQIGAPGSGANAVALHGTCEAVDFSISQGGTASLAFTAAANSALRLTSDGAFNYSSSGAFTTDANSAVYVRRLVWSGPASISGYLFWEECQAGTAPTGSTQSRWWSSAMIAPSGAGFMAKASGLSNTSFLARSMAAASGKGLSWTSADGVAGNPTLDLALASATEQGAAPATGSTADRVLAFTGGVMSWLQVTANMLASNAVTNVKVSTSAAIAWTKMAAIGVKGGLVTATGTAASNHAILSPGADASVLVADSAAASGLSWSSDLSAYLRSCTTQTTLTTDYTFTGSEVRGAGYAVDTSAAARTITVNADLFPTGYEFSICKWTTDANSVTLDAGTGNNIDGAQTYKLLRGKEVVVLVKDGADTWKIKAGHIPRVMTTQGDLVVAGASGVETRLPKGSDTQVLTMVSGAPAWAAGGGGSAVYAQTLTYYELAAIGGNTRIRPLGTDATYPIVGIPVMRSGTIRRFACIANGSSGAGTMQVKINGGAAQTLCSIVASVAPAAQAVATTAIAVNAGDYIELLTGTAAFSYAPYCTLEVS